MADDPWYCEAKGLLRAEIKRRDLTYPQLAERLRGIGVEETPASIANKISRGSFSAAFMIQVLKAIGCSNLRIEG
ncbi:DUF6471 domain-containing protein [Azospirillum sp. sgz302134]